MLLILKVKKKQEKNTIVRLWIECQENSINKNQLKSKINQMMCLLVRCSFYKLFSIS